MNGFVPTTGIFVASAPVDLRKAFDGPAIFVRNSLGHDPLDGSLNVFMVMESESKIREDLEQQSFRLPSTHDRLALSDFEDRCRRSLQGALLR